MFWRRLPITLIALLTALVSVIGMSSLAHAAPNTARSAMLSAPKEGAMVVLADTSIDGPAIARTYSPSTVIAWTGTDKYHHLNLMTSSDGLRYSNKIILPEYSLWRPAIAFIDSGRGAPYGTIVLAWTGTDANHTLNMAFIKTPGYTFTQKFTFWGEMSFTAPALVTINGDVNSDIYLSWSGTDSAHTLNVMHRTTFPVTQSKIILRGWTSISRPNLSTNPLLLSWTGTDNRIYFADSTNGGAWKQPSTSPLTYKSAWAPSMIGLDTSVQPTHWLAWTGSGTTSTRVITVMYTQHYPNWSDVNAKTALTEWAISSPTLVYSGNGETSSVLIGWAGTDAAHHLNVAVISA